MWAQNVLENSVLSTDFFSSYLKILIIYFRWKSYLSPSLYLLIGLYKVYLKFKITENCLEIKKIYKNKEKRFTLLPIRYYQASVPVKYEVADILTEEIRNKI